MRKEEFSTLPKLVQQYLVYIEAIKGHSEKSVLEYASDLRTFFRYIVKLKGLYSFDTEACLTTNGPSYVGVHLPLGSL